MRNWLNTLSRLPHKPRRSHRNKTQDCRQARRLFLEPLEDRRLLTTTVSLAMPDSETLEGHASNRAVLEISRDTDDDAEPLTVGLSFDTSSASSGDYVLEDAGGNALASQTEVTIPADATMLSVYVRAVGDSGLEGSETLVVTLIPDPGDPPAFDLGTDTQTVTLLDNGPPTIQLDSYSTDEDTPLTRTAAEGVLANDTDAAGDTLTVELTSDASLGTLALSPDGSFTYEPEANFNGSDSFSYRISDGWWTSDPVVVSLTINAVNDPPAAADNAFSLDEDQSLTRYLSEYVANSSDVDGDWPSGITVELVSAPQHGQFSLSGSVFYPDYYNAQYSYTPDPNYNGTDSFTYRLHDGQIYSNVATVTLTVNPVNDAPVASGESYSVNEDTQLDVSSASGLLPNDTDVDGDALIAVVASGPGYGTLNLNADGSFSYLPNANYYGSDSFTYSAWDGQAYSSPVTVSITVDAVYDAPVALNDGYSLDEDNSLAVGSPGVFVNDSRVDGYYTEFYLNSSPQHGQFQWNGDGTFTYQPDSNYFGSDSFGYYLYDGISSSAIATVTLTVNSINDLPVASDDAFSLDEDVVLWKYLSDYVGNDSDVDSDWPNGITVELVSPPQHGQFSFSGSAYYPYYLGSSYSYTPDPNYHGTDYFTYRLYDGQAYSNVATATFTVNPVNDAPVAVGESYSTSEDSPLTVGSGSGLLLNDSDVEGDGLTAVLASAPQHGSLYFSPDGSFTYTPNENYNGSDSFSYYASDGSAAGNTVTVDLTISPVNDPPIARDDTFSLTEDNTLYCFAPGILANDQELDGESFSPQVSNWPSSGDLSFGSDGSFNYTPAVDFSGAVTFSYYLTDSSWTYSNTATVTLTINPVNDAPVAIGESYSVNEDTQLDVSSASGLLPNDTDVDGDALTAVVASGPSYGTLNLNADGSFSYLPNANYNGSDSFTYSAWDGQAYSSPVTVSITVDAVYDAPVALNDGYSLDEDNSLAVGSPGVFVNDSRVDGYYTEFYLNSSPQHGQFQWNGDGTFTYQPDSNYFGSDSFGYYLYDGMTYSAVATVTLTVNSVNDRPVASDDAYFVTGYNPFTVAAISGLLANDSDLEGETLTAVLVSNPTHGSLSLASNGSFTYTPNAQFAGMDSFTYRASDGPGDSNTATVTIEVTDQDQPPTLEVDASTSLLEDSLVELLLTVGDDETQAGELIVTAVSSNQALLPDANLVLGGSGANRTLTLTPLANQFGSTALTITVLDGSGLTTIKTVEVSVAAVNDPPEAQADSYLVRKNSTLTLASLGVLAGDSDIDRDSLTAELVDGPLHGTLTLQANGSFTYRPNTGYLGSDQFTYRATDSQTTSAVATVTISVVPGPTAIGDIYRTVPEAPLVAAAAGVLMNDRTTGGLSLTAQLIAQPQHGSLSLNADGSFVYTPAAGFVGIDLFRYAAHDGVIASQPTSVAIDVRANTAPSATVDSYTSGEDRQLAVSAAEGLLSNDTDADGDVLLIELVSLPAVGELVLLGDGSFLYEPPADYHGDVQFSYRAIDGRSASSSTQVTLHITSLNEPPNGMADSYSAAPGTLLVVAPASGLLANDQDSDGDVLSAHLVAAPRHGTLTLAADGGFTYLPATGYHGRDQFTYVANDAVADSLPVLVQINVSGESVALLAGEDFYATSQDQTLVVGAAMGLLANDLGGNSPTTVELASPPNQGTLTLSSDGSFVYAPAAGFHGTVSFEYRLRRGATVSAAARAYVFVKSVVANPTTATDSYSLSEDATLSVSAVWGVLANDPTAGGASLTVRLAAPPQHGVLTLASNGSFTYAPDQNFSGEDHFQYFASDGLRLSAATTVSLSVTPSNDAPQAAPDAFLLNRDETLTIHAAAGLLTNDRDPDNDPLTTTAVTLPAHGTLTLSASGAFVYTPASGYSGPDQFSYTVSDGVAVSAPVMVTLTIDRSDDTLATATIAPELAGIGFVELTGRIGDEQSGMLDVDIYRVYLTAGQQLVIDVDARQAGAAGWLSLLDGRLRVFNAAGVELANIDDAADPVTRDYSLDPAWHFIALEEGNYYVGISSAENDDYDPAEAQSGVSGGTGQYLLRLGLNSPPTPTADAYVVHENQTLRVSAAGGVLANDSDANNNVLTALLVSEPLHGTVNLLPDGSFRYTPSAGYVGTDSFAYIARDQFVATASIVVTLNILAVNDPPVATADRYKLHAGQTLVVSGAGVLANDTDEDSPALTAGLVSEPLFGEISWSADGGFTYTPNSHFVGQDRFTYQASDGDKTSLPQVVILDVRNRAPWTLEDIFTTAAGEPLVVSAGASVLANDGDPDGDEIHAILLPSSINGSLRLLADGSLEYTPPDEFVGIETFSYEAIDSFGASISGVAYIEVTNESFLAHDDVYRVAHDQTLNVSTARGVLANDWRLDGSPLSVELVTGPESGTLTLNSDGSFEFVPEPGTAGGVAFTYHVTCGAEQHLAQATILVANATPSTADMAFTVKHGRPLSVPATSGLLATTQDADEDALTAFIVTPPTHGTFVAQSDGSFVYEPEAGFVGEDTFTYAISDGVAASDQATVTIQVTNDLPVARNDVFQVRHDRVLNIASAYGLLINDLDADADALTVALLDGPNSGELSLANDGSFAFTPNEGFVGLTSFTYRTWDGAEWSSPATVEINVTNRRPLGRSDQYTIRHDTQLMVLAIEGVRRNDLDPDWESFAVVENVTETAHGSLTLNTDGSFVYQPHAGYAGEDSFSYVLTDGLEQSDPVSVTLFVTDRAPQSWGEYFQVPHYGGLTVTEADGLLSNDADGDAEPIVAILKVPPQHGSLTLNEDGSFSYLPDPDFVGIDSFEYVAFDGALESDSTRVLLDRSNRAPLATPDAYTVVYGNTLVVSATSGVLANDFDFDAGDLLSAELMSNPSHGSLDLAADGSFTYQPSWGFVGDDFFFYRATDGITKSPPVRVDVVVTNHAPVAVSDKLTVTHDHTGNWTWSDLLANDLDPDPGQTLTVQIYGQTQHGSFWHYEDDFAYTPAAGFVGTELLSYRISDGVTTSPLTLLTIEVVNSAPVVNDDAYTATEDVALVVAAVGSGDEPSGVLHNDSDADGDALTATLVAAPRHGSVTLFSDGSFEYVPAANYSGADSFRYAVFDGVVRREATARITVAAVDDMPAYSGAALRAHAGKWARLNLLDEVEYPDDERLTLEIVDLPTHGDLTWQADGEVAYRANAGYTGPDSFTFRIVKDAQAGELLTASIDVVNADPDGVDRSYMTYVDYQLDVTAADGLLAWATDADGDTLVATLNGNPAHGSLTLREDGSFTYLPDNGYVGGDVFFVTISDGISGGETITVTIGVSQTPIVTRANRYSVLHDDILTVNSPIGVLRNDWHVQGLPITAILEVMPPELPPWPAHGTVSLAADGSFLYVPAAGYVGPDAFQYRATDGTETTEPVWVWIDVRNNVPVATDDRFRVHRGEPLTVPAAGALLINDYDDNGEPLSIEIVAAPEHGEVLLNLAGGFTYQPGALIDGRPFVGIDTFTYRVFDGAEWSEPATVTIAVENRLPEGKANRYRIHHTGGLELNAAEGVLRDDFDFDGDPLFALPVDQPEHGELVLAGNGSFTYFPDQIETEEGNRDFVGTDVFTYRLFDGAEFSPPITVTIEVWNNVPVSVTDLYTVKHGQSLHGASSVLENDVDWDEDVLTAELVADTYQGVLNLASDGTFTFDPGQTPDGRDFQGTVEFSYRAFDGAEYGPETTVTIEVLNQSPIGVPDYFARPHGERISGNVLTNASGPTGVTDSDPDHDELTAELVQAPAHASWFELRSDGEFDFDPESTFVGTTTFTYRVADAVGPAPETITVTLHVTSGVVYAVNDYVTVRRLANPVSIPILANDIFPDRGALRVEVINQPAEGQVEFLAAGAPEGGPELPDRFVFTPYEGVSLPFSVQFDYFISDFPEAGGQEPQSVATVTITLVEDQIAAAADRYFVGVGDTIAENIRANDKVLRLNATGGGFSELPAAETGWEVELVSHPQHGQLTGEWDPSGSFIYSPSPGTKSGTIDTFTYRYKNAPDGMNTTTKVAIYIGVNRPEVGDGLFELSEDGQLTIQYAELHADAGTYIARRAPRQGTLQPVYNQQTGESYLVYHPNANYHGVDSFTYAVSNGNVESKEVYVRLVVSPTNDAPVASNDYAVVHEDDEVEIDVLANDWDRDPQPELLEEGSWIEIVSGPEVGEATIQDGKIRYIPPENFYGVTGLVYRLHDRAQGAMGESNPEDLSDEATLVIYVTANPDEPLASGNHFIFQEDHPGSLNLAEGVRDDDHFQIDANGDLVYATPWGQLVELGDLPSIGVLTGMPVMSGLSDSFSVYYEPPPNWNGTQNFTFTWYDTDWFQQTITATIEVQAVNDAPFAEGDYVETRGTSVTYNVLANDWDIENDALTITDVSEGATFSGSSITYTRPPGDTVTPAWRSVNYTISDGNGGTATGTLNIHFLPEPSEPEEEGGGGGGGGGGGDGGGGPSSEGETHWEFDGSMSASGAYGISWAVDGGGHFVVDISAGGVSVVATDATGCTVIISGGGGSWSGEVSDWLSFTATGAVQSIAIDGNLYISGSELVGEFSGQDVIANSWGNIGSIEGRDIFAYATGNIGSIQGRDIYVTAGGSIESIQGRDITANSGGSIGSIEGRDVNATAGDNIDSIDARDAWVSASGDVGPIEATQNVTGIYGTGNYSSISAENTIQWISIGGDLTGDVTAQEIWTVSARNISGNITARTGDIRWPHGGWPAPPNGVAASGMLTGDVEATLGAIGTVHAGSISGSTIKAGESIGWVWSNGSIYATIDAGTTVGTVQAGGSLSGSVKSGQSIDSVSATFSVGGTIDAGTSIGSISAGTSVSGTIEAGTFIGSIWANNGDVAGSIAAGEDIGPVTASKNVTAQFDAERDVSHITAQMNVSAAIEAGRNVGQITATRGNVSGSVTAGRDVAGVSAAIDISVAIQAAGQIGPVRAERDITATLKGDRGVNSVSAGRDILAGSGIESSRGSVGNIWASRDLTAKVTASDSIDSIKVGRNATSEVKAGMNIGNYLAGVLISGPIEAEHGSIGTIVAGANIYSWYYWNYYSPGAAAIDATRDGKLSSPSIKAFCDISLIQANAVPGNDGQIGTSGTATAIWSQAGSIGGIIAAGSMDVTVLASQNIGSIIASGYNAGDLQGNMETEQGNIGSVMSNGGDIRGQITSARDLGQVIAADDLSAPITARRHIGNVEAGNDITSPITSLEGDIGRHDVDWGWGYYGYYGYYSYYGYYGSYGYYQGAWWSFETPSLLTNPNGLMFQHPRNDWEQNLPSVPGVSAGNNITGNIDAWGNIGAIAAGFNIGQENMKIGAGIEYEGKEIDLTRGNIQLIRAGLHRGGDINATILASGHIGEITAFGEVAPTIARPGEHLVPIGVDPELGNRPEGLAGPEFTADGLNKPRILDPLLEEREVGASGNIQGKIVGRTMSLVAAYGNVVANVGSQGDIAQVWALGNINDGRADKSITSGEGAVTIDAWGKVGGGIGSGLDGTVTVRAYGKIEEPMSPESTSSSGQIATNGTVNLASWSKLTANISAAGNGKTWSYQDTAIKVSGLGSDLVSATWGSLAEIAETSGKIVAKAIELNDIDYTSPYPAFAISAGDATNLKFNTTYALIGAPGNISNLNLNSISAEIISGKNLTNSTIKTLGRDSSRAEWFSFAMDMLRSYFYTPPGSPTPGRLYVRSGVNIAVLAGDQAIKNLDQVPVLAAEMGRKIAEFVVKIEDAVKWTADAVSGVFEAAEHYAEHPNEALEDIDAAIQAARRQLTAFKEQAVKAADETIRACEYAINNLEKVKAALQAKIEEAVDSVVGFSAITVLGNVTDLQADVATSLVIAAGSVTDSDLVARNVEITVAGDLDAKVTARHDVTVHAFGSVDNVIDAGRVIEVHSRGNVSAALTGTNAIGVETWGSVTGALKSNGAIRVEAYGDVTGAVTGLLASSISTWGNLTGAVTALQGAIDVFAAGNVTADLIAGADISVDAWRSITASKFSAGENRTPKEDEEFGIEIVALGDVQINDIAADNSIDIVAQGTIRNSWIYSGVNAGGKVTVPPGKSAGVSIQAMGAVSGVTVLANDGIDVTAIQNITGRYEAKAEKSGISLTAHGNVSSNVIKAGKFVDITADGLIDATVTVLSGSNSEVSLTALGHITGALEGTASIDATVTAPYGKVNFFANGDVNLLTQDFIIVKIAGEDVKQTIAWPSLVAGTAMQNLTGTIIASDSLDLSAWNDMVNLKAKAEGHLGSKVMLFAGNNIASTDAFSGGILSASAIGTLHGDFRSGTQAPEKEGDATIKSLGDILSSTKVAANGSASVQSEATLNSQISAGKDAFVAAKVSASGQFQANENVTVEVYDGSAQGTITAGKNAVLVAQGPIFGRITAGTLDAEGKANVSSFTSLTAIVTAPSDVDVSAYQNLSGTFRAGRDLAVLSAHPSGLFEATRSAAIMAAGSSAAMQGVVRAGLNANVSSTGTLIADITAGNDAQVFSVNNMRVHLKALAGNATLTTGGDAWTQLEAAHEATLFTAGHLAGSVEAINITATVWKDLIAELSAWGDAEVGVEGSLLGSIDASLDVEVAIMGTQPGAITAGHDARVLVGSEAVGDITAGNDLSLDARASAVGQLTADNDVTVTALGTLFANVQAGRHAEVIGWGTVRNIVNAGQNATVMAAGPLNAIVAAQHEASITAFDTVLLNGLAGETLTLVAYGPTRAQLESAGTISATVLGPAQIQAAAPGQIDVVASGLLNVTATSTTGGVDVVGYGGVLATVIAAGDASVAAVGALSGSVTAGGMASVMVVGSGSSLVVNGAMGVSAFGSELLSGTFASAGGEVSVAGGTLLNVNVDAAGDASVLGLDDVIVTVRTGGSAEVFAGGALFADVEAAGDASTSSLAEGLVTIAAGGTAGAMSLGSGLALINAVGDVWAASYGHLRVELASLSDVTVVWARGNLAGAVSAVGTIGRLVSYGELEVAAAAREIKLVQAWGAIGGAIEAIEAIGLVRSGEGIEAIVDAPEVGSVLPDDKSVFGDYPELPQVSLASLRAWLRGLQRDLADAKAALAEERAGELRGLAAELAAAMEGQAPSLGDHRQVRGVVQLARNEVLAALARARTDDDIALATAQRNLQLAADQLRGEAFVAKTLDKYDLRQYEAQSAAELQAVTGAMARRLVQREELRGEKEQERLASLQRFTAQAANWPLDFADQVWTLVGKRVGQALDILQLMLDLLGFLDLPIPIGPIADLINSGISILRGDFTGAALSAVAAIPIVGNAAGVPKVISRLAGPIYATLKYGDELLDLSRAVSKSIKYVGKLGTQLVRPAGKLASQIPGFCDFGRSVGRRLGATDDFIDAIGIGCFEYHIGLVYGRVPQQAGGTETTPVVSQELLALVAGVVTAGVTGGMFVRCKVEDKRQKRKEFEALLDQLFAGDDLLDDSEIAKGRTMPNLDEDSLLDALASDYDDKPNCEGTDMLALETELNSPSTADGSEINFGAQPATDRAATAVLAKTAPKQTARNRTHASRGSSRWNLCALFAAMLCGLALACYGALGLWNASTTAPPTKSAGPPAKFITRPIGEAQPGEWVLAKNPLGPEEDDVEIDNPDEWRSVWLKVDDDYGWTVEIHTLQEVAALQELEASVGSSVEVRSLELEADGEATVVAIGPCPTIGPRPSPEHHLIRTKFRRHSDNVISVRTEGSQAALGVTTQHPFWSLDREEFVAAGELQSGECVSDFDGESFRVLELDLRRRSAEVFNVEVAGEHTYCVGPQGIIVHNACSAIKSTVRKGKLGETLAGIPKVPKREIKSMSKSATRRFPDYFDENILWEVKNRSEVGLTNQLKDFMLYAKDKSLTFILQTRKNTKISPDIEAYAKKLGIAIEIVKGLK